MIPQNYLSTVAANVRTPQRSNIEFYLESERNVRRSFSAILDLSYPKSRNHVKDKSDFELRIIFNLIQWEAWIMHKVGLKVSLNSE